MSYTGDARTRLAERQHPRGGDHSILRAYVASIVLALLASISAAALGQPTTYGGVTFPLGDLAFADRVVTYVEGSCVRCAFANPAAVLGRPDCSDGSGCMACSCCDTCALSLGFRLSELDNRGYVTVEFVDNRLVDGPGADLFIYITNGKACRVEISADGADFIRVGETKSYPAALDIGPFVQPGQEFRFVRVWDVPADEDTSSCPGPNVDAIGAMGTAQAISEAVGTLQVLSGSGQLSFFSSPITSGLLIALDTSSSMGDPFEGSTRIEVAKGLLTELVDSFPDASLVGLCSFSGCDQESRLLVPIGPLNRTALKTQIRSLQPGGATAIQDLLEQAKLDFAGVPGTKTILLVSDGSETCGGDPVAAAKALIATGYNLKVAVVGFGVAGNARARDQLSAIAAATGQVYFSAETSQALREALRLASLSPVHYGVFDAHGAEVLAGVLGDPGPKLPVGTYHVVIGTSPPLEVSNVCVEQGRTTQITLTRSTDGYFAKVKS